jgi:hypothetical protein
MTLILERAVAQLTEPVEEDRLGQGVASLLGIPGDPLGGQALDLIPEAIRVDDAGRGNA